MPSFNERSALLLKRSIDAGITSPAELSNIMGNASVETWGFTTMDERFTYRSADQLIASVSSADERFTREQIKSAIDSHDPKQVAKVMYDNRPEIGNTEPGDGWKYHGRGYFQFTGKDNYEKFGDKFNIDLIDNPSKAADPETAAKLAVKYWKDKVPDDKREDARAAGEIINGGSNGAEARVIASEQWAKTITSELVSDVKSGKITLEQLGNIGDEKAAGLISPPILHQGMRSNDVRHAQDELHELGYLRADPNGRFGPQTKAATEEFQRAQRLEPDGKIGRITQGRLDAVEHEHQAAMRDQQISDFTTSLPPLRSFSDPAHPQNALYCALQEGFPMGTAQKLLTQATAACYMSGIKRPDDLGKVVGANGKILFESSSLFANDAKLDLSQPIPSVQQTMQQVQQFDLSQAQTSMQAPNAQVQPGPMSGVAH